ncbi:MAG TPA: aspartyl protease family protein [Puia sp.]|nr:aspartyl protease family protein [Puia sp.]
MTITYAGISNRIICSVQINFAESLISPGENLIRENCIAVWDTGATNSGITELAAQKLKLAPIGRKKVSGLGGTIEKNTYIIDIILPNNVRFPNVAVTEIENPIDENGKKVDVFGILLGMDIIGAGDFTVTNFEGKTVMSFRIPSQLTVNYVEEWNRRKSVMEKYKRR